MPKCNWKLHVKSFTCLSTVISHESLCASYMRSRFFLPCAYRLEVKYCWVLSVRYTISCYITNYKFRVHYIHRVRQDEKNIPKIFRWRWSKPQVTASLFCRYKIIASSFVYFGSSIASVKPWDHLNKNLPTMGLRSFVEVIKTLQKIKRNAVPFKFTGVE